MQNIILLRKKIGKYYFTVSKEKRACRKISNLFATRNRLCNDVRYAQLTR